MTKKEMLVQFHKDAISSVAGRLFQENGYAQTTMDEIAREADYSKATLYVYFKSKEEIFCYIALQAMRMMLARITAAQVASPNALAQYKAICWQLAAFSEEHPYYYSSLLETIRADEDSRKEAPILEEIYQAGEQVNAKIAAVFQAGIQQNLFRDTADTLPLGLLFWAAISSAIQFASNKAAYIAARMGMSRQEFLDFSFRTLLQSILQEGIQYDDE